MLGGVCQGFLQLETADPPSVQLRECDRWMFLIWILSRGLFYFGISAQEGRYGGVSEYTGSKAVKS